MDQVPDEVATPPATSVEEENNSSATEMAFESEESWWRFLDRKTPEELVEIFSSTDPLRLNARCARYIWDEGLLLEVDRVVERAIHHVAFRAARRPENAPLDEWLTSCIAESAQRVVRTDEEMVRRDYREVEAWASAHAFIRDAFGLEEVAALRVCSAFNGMLPRERKAFFALCMEKRSVEETLAAGFGPPEWLRQTCLRGLDLILGIDQPDAGSRPQHERESNDD